MHKRLLYKTLFKYSFLTSPNVLNIKCVNAEKFIQIILYDEIVVILNVQNVTIAIILKITVWVTKRIILNVTSIQTHGSIKIFCATSKVIKIKIYLTILKCQETKNLS